MRPAWRWRAGLLAVLAGMGVACAYTEAPGEVVHFTQAQWRMEEATGFSKPPAQLASPAAAPWQTVALPHARRADVVRQAATAASAGAQRTTRTTWYRLAVPSELRTTQGPLVLYGARVKAAGTVAVYADGQLVYRAQQQGPLWNSARTPLWVPLEAAANGLAPRELVIRLEHPARTQVALSSLRLGPADALEWRYRLRHWFAQELPAMVSAAFLAVGIFALFVWFGRRHDVVYLLFFVLAIISFTRGVHGYSDQLIAHDWFAWLTVNSLPWLVTATHVSMARLHGRPLVWLTRTLFALCGVVALLTLPTVGALPLSPQVTPMIYGLAALMAVAVAITGTAASWRDSRDGRLLALSVVTGLVLGANDWLLQNNFTSPEGWYLGDYMNAATFSIMGYLLYGRYTSALSDMERSNVQLEQRLREREAELAASYQSLREAEHRQTLHEERQRLTQDMHDGMGASLVSALRVVESGRGRDEDVAEVLKGCIDDLKLTIDSMEPVEADLLLLLATLRFRLGPRLAHAGITLRWEVADVPRLDWLDARNALHILRILQEAFTNILKHTRSTEVSVSTVAERDGISVVIVDNGDGFSVDEALQGGGKGLNNQLRRARALGGDVKWDPRTDGTRMTLWLPQRRTESA